jgi:diacylglycerol kinase family enzyme
MKPFYLIINPSRYPTYSRHLEKVSRRLSRGIILTSSSPEHFRQLIYEFCRSSVEYLLVWGGDGTANTAINVLMEHRDEWVGRKHIGFLRGGSGNGIQDSYEVPMGLRKQIRTYLDSIEHGYTQEVDLLRLQNGREVRYGQLVGLGLDAEVLDIRNRVTGYGGSQVKPGLPGYAKAGIRVLGRGLKSYRSNLTASLAEGKYALRGPRTNAEIPFREANFTSRAPLVEIGTRPYYGSFFKICPDVVCNDGYLGVYFYNFTSALSVFFNLPYLWRGKHHLINHHWAKKGHPLIERFEVKEARLLSPTPFKAHIDGELISPAREERGYSIGVNIEPRALDFLVPQTFYVKFHPDFLHRDRASRIV